MKRVITVAVVLLLAARAGAQDRATADALFDEAKKLMAAGEVTKACAKLEGSQRILPRLGVQLNLADCYEKDGRTASAWTEWRAAAAVARKAGDNREALATANAAGLEKKLTRLKITVADTPGVVVKRDGVVIDPVLYDTPTPVNPGVYKIEATAPKKETWTQKVEARGEGAVVTVEVPELHAPRPIGHKDPDPRGEDPVDEPPSRGKGRKITGGRAAGVVTGTVVGLVGVVAGTVFGIYASSKSSEAHDTGHCDDMNRCDATGFALINDARRAGVISTISFGVGLVAVGAGVVLYLTAPKAGPSERTTLTPTLSPHGAGVTLSGSF
jgi:hypothetical protein